MSAQVEALAADALRRWLLLQLPAKVAEINALRAAVLRSPYAGPFAIPPHSTLGLIVTNNTPVYTQAPLTSGTSQTAAQVASDINAVAALAGTASADPEGRLVVTSPSPPTDSAPSVAKIRPAIGGDVNAVFGWELGGLRRVHTAHIAPTQRGVMDGWPVYPDFGVSSEAGTPLVVIIGDRESVPCLPGPRVDEYFVTMDITVLRAEGLEQDHRSREGIQSALRCVREVILQDAGRNLGRGAYGDVMLVTEKSARISGMPFSFGNSKSPNPLYDAAQLTLVARVFERPAAT